MNSLHVAECPARVRRWRRAGVVLPSWFMILALGLPGSGCKKSEVIAEIEPVKKPERAISRLEAAYPAPAPETKTVLTELNKSLKEQNYEGAAVGLQVLQMQPRSFEQSQVLNALMSGLQKELAEAAERGDPKALRAIEQLRRSTAR